MQRKSCWKVTDSSRGSNLFTKQGYSIDVPPVSWKVESLFGLRSSFYWHQVVHICTCVWLVVFVIQIVSFYDHLSRSCYGSTLPFWTVMNECRLRFAMGSKYKLLHLSKGFTLWESSFYKATRSWIFCSSSAEPLQMCELIPFLLLETC